MKLHDENDQNDRNAEETGKGMPCETRRRPVGLPVGVDVRDRARPAVIVSNETFNRPYHEWSSDSNRERKKKKMHVICTRAGYGCRRKPVGSNVVKKKKIHDGKRREPYHLPGTFDFRFSIFSKISGSSTDSRPWRTARTRVTRGIG